MSYLLSERHFRNHEHYIHRIVEQFPLVVTFDLPPQIRQSDVLARNIRYAGNSLMQEQWQPTNVDMIKFMQVWDDITVSTAVAKGKVTCGPDTALATMGATGAEYSGKLPSQLVPAVRLENPPTDLLTAICVLHHYRYLTEPSIITSTDDLTWLTTKSWDIAVRKDGNEYTIL